MERSLIIKAAWNNTNADVVKVLIEKGAKVDALNNLSQTPLHRAAYNNTNADVVKVLIEKGAKVDALDDFSQTPLHRAA